MSRDELATIAYRISSCIESARSILTQEGVLQDDAISSYMTEAENSSRKLAKECRHIPRRAHLSEMRKHLGSAFDCIAMFPDDRWYATANLNIAYRHLDAFCKAELDVYVNSEEEDESPSATVTMIGSAHTTSVVGGDAA